MRNSILVTGASGFIGRQALLPLQKKGFEVHTVSRSSCNLLDRKQTEELIKKIKPSHLLHSAWVTEHGKFWQAPENNNWLDASKNLFRAFVENGGRRIVVIGSCAEYDWRRKDGNPWRESDLCIPHTPYGKAKLDLLEWLEKSQMNYAWARLFMLFGPHENPARIIPYLIVSALKNTTAECSSGMQVRDFLDTETCGRILAEISGSVLTGPVNVASGKGYSLKDIAAKISAILKKPGNYKFGAIPDRPDDPPHMVADIKKLAEIVDVKNYGISAALEKNIGWWKKNHSNKV